MIAESITSNPPGRSSCRLSFARHPEQQSTQQQLVGVPIVTQLISDQMMKSILSKNAK